MTNNYLKPIDGLRGLAILLVIMFHLNIANFGWAGVILFFVLSGYLITKVLHDEKEGHSSLKIKLRNFWARRVLRIFPLYYLYFFILLLVLILKGISFSISSEDFSRYNTKQIRDKFLLENLLQPDKIECVYTHYDRMIVGAAYPIDQSLQLQTYEELRADHFLSRRELGIINIAGNGHVSVDDEKFELEKQDCLYIGKGKQKIVFSSVNKSNPAKFILFSCPAHQEFPTRLMKPAEALPAEMGSLDNNNHRVINKYIHNDGIQSCQLVLGVTNFKKGSIWNTMPPHLHDRRMESYFYFDLPEGQRVIHFMGQPQETRHIFLNNEEAILSPAWSIHSGTATASYSFIWAMAGENKVFTDMDPVPVQTLR